MELNMLALKELLKEIISTLDDLAYALPRDDWGHNQQGEDIRRGLHYLRDKLDEALPEK